jgi:coproporphyrinogen III oxidase
MQTKHPQISEWFKKLQDSICKDISAADGYAEFKEDSWTRPGGGGGRSRVIAQGAVIEKGGVNFSEVYGRTPDSIKGSMGLSDDEFYATGVSIVLHPNNPMVPIIHMNVRFFEMSGGAFWFGGGIDLTPHYIVPDDARYFHQALKNACDKHNGDYYAKFKNWADEYFFIPHRKETRGIGGIFFDYLKPDENKSFNDLWTFVQEVGNSFAPIYTHFMLKNKSLPYEEQHKNWQYLRRGRYVEFNLVWDRGTRFGLQTDGRTESILMSLPPQANWEYQHEVKPGSAEEFTLNHLKKGLDWLA